MDGQELKQMKMIVDRLEKENRALKAELDIHHKLEAQQGLIQKMEAVSSFSGRIAHDFNNILHSILRCVEVALLSNSGDSPIFQILKEIKSNIQDAGLFTEKLMAIGGEINPNVTPQNLNSIIKGTEKLFRKSITGTIEIQLALADDLMGINADSEQIKQMLMNLFVNAVDAMAENGRLIIKTENIFLKDAPARQLVTLPPGDYVRLTVSDNGCGLPPDKLKHMYEPFFTTKQKGKGHGLGLSMVYAFVKNHGGFIECSSTEGEGTIFKIDFPALGTEQQPAQIEGSENLTMHKKDAESILIIDDEDYVLEIGKQFLQRYGYTVLTAGNSEEGIALYSKSTVDLVLLDLGLPRIDGIKCLKKLLSIDRNAKIIIISGDFLNGRTQETLKIGAKAFLAKPYRLTELLNTVRKVLGSSPQEKT